MNELEKRQFEFLKNFFEHVTKQKLFSEEGALEKHLEELEDKFDGLMYNLVYETKRPSRLQSAEKIHKLEEDLKNCDAEIGTMCYIFGQERKKRDMVNEEQPSTENGNNESN